RTRIDRSGRSDGGGRGQWSRCSAEYDRGRFRQCSSGASGDYRASGNRVDGDSGPETQLQDQRSWPVVHGDGSAAGDGGWKNSDSERIERERQGPPRKTKGKDQGRRRAGDYTN